MSARHAFAPVLRPPSIAAASTTNNAAPTTNTTAATEERSLRWLPARYGAVPQGAVIAAYDDRTNPIYIARVCVPPNLYNQHDIIANGFPSHIARTGVNQLSAFPNPSHIDDIDLGMHYTYVDTTRSPLLTINFPYTVAQLQPLYKAAITTYPLTPVSSANNPRPMQYATHAYDVLCVVRDAVAVRPSVAIDIAGIAAVRQQQQQQQQDIHCSPCTSASDLTNATSYSLPSSTSSSASTSASSSAQNLFIPHPSIHSNNDGTSTTDTITGTATLTDRRISDVAVSTVVNDTSVHTVTITQMGEPTHPQSTTATAVATRLRALCLARRQRERTGEMQLQLQHQNQHNQHQRTRQHRMELRSRDHMRDSSADVVAWLDADSGRSVAGAIKTGVTFRPIHRHREAHRNGHPQGCEISYQIARRRPRPRSITTGSTENPNHVELDTEVDLGIVVGNLAFGAYGFAWVPDYGGNAIRNAVASCDYQILAIISDDDDVVDDNRHTQQHQHQPNDVNNHSRVSWKPIDLDLLSSFSPSPSSSSSRSALNGIAQRTTIERTRRRRGRRRRMENERVCADQLVVAGHTLREEGVVETYVARVRIGDVDMPATYVPSLCAALCVTGDGEGRTVARRKFELLCVRGHNAGVSGSAALVRGGRCEKQRRRVGAIIMTMEMMIGEASVSSSTGIRGVERFYRRGQRGWTHASGNQLRNESYEDDYDEDYDDYEEEGDEEEEEDSDWSCQAGGLSEQSLPAQDRRRAAVTEFESGISRSNHNCIQNTITNSTVSNRSSSISTRTGIYRNCKSHTMSYETFDHPPSTTPNDCKGNDQESYDIAQYGLHWVHCTDGDIPRNAVVAFDDDATLITPLTPTNAGCTYVARLCVSGSSTPARNGSHDDIEENDTKGTDFNRTGDASRYFVAAGVRRKEIAVATTVMTRRSRRRAFNDRETRSNINDRNSTKRHRCPLQLSTLVNSEYDVLTMETITSSASGQGRMTADASLRWVSVELQDIENDDGIHATNRSPLLASEGIHQRTRTRWRIPGNAIAVCVNEHRAVDMRSATRTGAFDANTLTEPEYVLRARRVFGTRGSRGNSTQEEHGGWRGRWRVGTFKARRIQRTGCDEGAMTTSQWSARNWGLDQWDWDWECEVLCVFPSNTRNSSSINVSGQQQSEASCMGTTNGSGTLPMFVRIDFDADRHHRETHGGSRMMLASEQEERSGVAMCVSDGLTGNDDSGGIRWQWRPMDSDEGREAEWEEAERKRARARMLAITSEVGMCLVVGIYLVWIFGLWPSG